MWREHGDRVQFFVVYIREAHPVDGFWPLGDEAYVQIEDPSTLEERDAVAQVCLARLDLEPIPALVDEMDDAVAQDYAARPDRLYLIGEDGRVVYRGAPGPFGFHPGELDEAIRRHVQP